MTGTKGCGTKQDGVGVDMSSACTDYHRKNFIRICSWRRRDDMHHQVPQNIHRETDMARR